MSKVLMGVVLILVVALYFFYSQNENLTALNKAYELRDMAQKETIAQLEQDFESQTKGLLEIQQRNNAIEGEMNRYLDIFKRHDLTKSAAAKPDQLEIRVNNGTKKVFDSIEEDSRNIDDLDDGLQLQPATN